MQADLVKRARNGDREAFGRLAAGEVDRLVFFARLILRDADQADDAVQEALFRCWRQLPNLRDVDRFDGWLYRILVRTAADEMKRHHRMVRNIQVLHVESSGDDSLQLIADREQLERGFDRLSIDQRAVIVLRHYVGLPLVEVASALGIAPGTAKSRYHYAMSAMRAALDADARPTTRRKVVA